MAGLGAAPAQAPQPWPQPGDGGKREKPSQTHHPLQVKGEDSLKARVKTSKFIPAWSRASVSAEAVPAPFSAGKRSATERKASANPRQAVPDAANPAIALV